MINGAPRTSQASYTQGLNGIKQGKKIGYAKMMCTSLFYQGGSGNFSRHKRTLNELLVLPVEDIDELIARAIERSKAAQWVG